MKSSLSPRRRAAFVALGIAASTAVAALALAHAAPSMRYERIPRETYAVVAQVHAKPGKEEQLRKATLPLISQVRREPNNLVYFLHEDREAPGHFIFYEIFASQADFEAHNRTPHVKAWFARLPELADGDVKVTRMQVLHER